MKRQILQNTACFNRENKRPCQDMLSAMQRPVDHSRPNRGSRGDRQDSHPPGLPTHAPPRASARLDGLLQTAYSPTGLRFSS